MGVEQGSALSLVLSAIYLSLLIHIFEKCLKNLKIPVSILFFVDDGLFIAQNKSIVFLNSNLFYSYHIITFFLEKFGLVVEHGKTEVFHFFRSQGTFDPLLLDLTILGDPILQPKTSWRYLGFFLTEN